MSIDFTQSMAANQAAADSANFADLFFDSPLQRFEFPYTVSTAIFKFDVLPVTDANAYGRAAVHRLPTAKIICPQGTFGKPCPICEAIRARPRDDKDFWQAHHAKERAFLNVIPVDLEGGYPYLLNPQTDKSPVYVYDIGSSPKAKSGFWKLLTSALSSPAPEDSYKKLFCDWAHGLTLKLMLTPAELNGSKFMDVTGIEFIPRKTAYDKATWQPYCYQFPELFRCLDYDEIIQMSPHIFNPSAAVTTANTGYSPNVGAVDHRPDGVFPPGQQQSPPAPQGGFYPPAGQPAQQGGFYPPTQSPAQQGGFYPPAQGAPAPPAQQYAQQAPVVQQQYAQPSASIAPQPVAPAQAAGFHLPSAPPPPQQGGTPTGTGADIF